MFSGLKDAESLRFVMSFQVFKEEEEAIKVDLHEGCGRTKLFWVMALADSKTLKAMVEFREASKGELFNDGYFLKNKVVFHTEAFSIPRLKLSWCLIFATTGKVGASSVGTCRFCGTTDNTGILAIGNVCSDAECQVN